MLGLRRKLPPRRHHRSNMPQAAASCEPTLASNSRGRRSRREHWRRECQCGAEDYREPRVDRRARLDPLDPATARHLGQCAFASETDRDKLRLALKVKPGLEPGYDWVECSGCDCGWQVPHYAAESVG